MEISININTKDVNYCRLSLDNNGIFTITHTDIEGLPIQYNEMMELDFDDIVKAINILQNDREKL